MSEAKANVSVVIPNWNGIDFIAECLHSLQQQSMQAHIIVVDNGSTDNSRDLVARDFPGIELVSLPENTGFSGGVNTGIERALEQGAEFIALFNNDAVADKDWLKHLVDTAMNHPEAGIVTGKFMRFDREHLDSTGELYSVWGMPFPRGRNEPDKGQYDLTLEVFGATGGATLYRGKMLQEIGLFDQDFFAYYEDVDMSFRAQLAGWKVCYEPLAIAYHHVSGTSSKLGNFARYHSAKNFLLVYAKNMPRALYFKYLPLFCLQFCRMAATSLIRGKFITFLKGSWAAIRLHSTTKTKRRTIQLSSKVTVGYIDSILWHQRPPKPPLIEENDV